MEHFRSKPYSWEQFTDDVIRALEENDNPIVYLFWGACAAKKEMLIKQMEYMTEYFGDHYTAVNIRKHLPYYFAGTSVAKPDRQKLNFMDNTSDMIEVINSLDF